MFLPTLFPSCSPWYSAPARSRPATLTILACEGEAHTDEANEAPMCPICADEITRKSHCTPCDQCNSAYHVECWSKLEELYVICESDRPTKGGRRRSSGGIKCAVCNASTERFVHVERRPGFFNEKILRREHRRHRNRHPPLTVVTALVQRQLERLDRFIVQAIAVLSNEQTPLADKTKIAAAPGPVRRSSRRADKSNLRSSQLGRSQLSLDASVVFQETNKESLDRLVEQACKALSNEQTPLADKKKIATAPRPARRSSRRADKNNLRSSLLGRSHLGLDASVVIQEDNKESLDRLVVQACKALSNEQTPRADKTKIAAVPGPARRSSRRADKNDLRSSLLGRSQLGLNAAVAFQEANKEDRHFCSFVDTLVHQKRLWNRDSASTHSLTCATSDDESSRSISEEIIEPDDERRRSYRLASCAENGFLSVR